MDPDPGRVGGANSTTTQRLERGVGEPRTSSNRQRLYLRVGGGGVQDLLQMHMRTPYPFWVEILFLNQMGTAWLLRACAIAPRRSFSLLTLLMGNLYGRLVHFIFIGFYVSLILFSLSSGSTS